LVDGNHFVKINFPNTINVECTADYSKRLRFCCLIASNRAAAEKDQRVLYADRIEAIQWFETNAPEYFDLYGNDWDIPAAREGIFGKIQRQFWLKLRRVMTFNTFPSYRGRVESKKNVLNNTRFAICFENVRDLPGYITEKIFDCFFSGCVPVYWGASNVAEYIPGDCFIDRRHFRDTAELYSFLRAMSEVEFNMYQNRISTYLQSAAVHPFSSEFFAETVVTTIMQDIGL
jgi:alpha(1,3/1,4) fucosyltransferase